MAEIDDIEPQMIYRLVIDVAGPGYRDRITIEDEERDGLLPIWVNRGGHDWERYGEDDNYHEIRKDLVVARTLYRTPKVSEVQIEETIPEGASPDHPGRGLVKRES